MGNVELVEVTIWTNSTTTSSITGWKAMKICMSLLKGMTNLITQRCLKKVCRAMYTYVSDILHTYRAESNNT